VNVEGFLKSSVHWVYDEIKKRISVVQNFFKSRITCLTIEIICI